MSERTFPGESASAADLVELAGEFAKAADAARKEVRKGKRVTWAPTRLLYLHAMELYLNAWLRQQGKDAETVRSFHHRLKFRADAARELGLHLSARTLSHLAEIEEHREYLVARYAPERLGQLPNPTRLVASLKDIRNAVSRDFKTSR